MATRMQQRRGTAAQWTSANPVLAAGEIGFETDTSKFKIGDGSTTWSTLSYFVDGSQIIDNAPAALDTLNELAAALDDDANFASTITNLIDSKTPLVSKTNAAWEADNAPIAGGTVAYSTTDSGVKIGNGTDSWADTPYLVNVVSMGESIGASISDAISGILNDSVFTGTISLPETTSIGNVSSDEISYLNGVTSSVQAQISTLSGTVDDLVTSTTGSLAEKAPLDAPVFTGNVSLPATTEIGNVSAAELANLNGTTGVIQDQIDSKADKNAPTFTGTVVLPTTTSVGTVSSDEIGYLDGVTSSIQTQLDDKADAATVSTTYAPINNPTFTGTVALPANTSIGNVSLVEIAYLDGVTSDVQTQLDGKAAASHTHTIANVTGLQSAIDAKAPLDNPTFTGTLNAATVAISGNLTVGGTTTTTNTASFTVNDPLVYFGEGNTGNIVDLGFVASYNDGAYHHAGLARDASDNKWKLFSSVEDEPTTTINFAQAEYDTLVVGGIEFPDGVQVKQGVPSITTINQQTASYTTALADRDKLVEVGSASAATVTIPTDASVAYPVGTSIDILQTGTGQITIAGAAGVTVNATPGLKLRAQWSSATLFKRAENTWVVFGDLTA